ncbi:MAG TPA: 2Fe-2S iron-sulfur cluster binding domain-containing protein [Candidatus Omnitrophica bacterium]|nr:2Fe-2S iron-sulfur cluster binding domain-containing protein [Candidatus Omnitrophota bacterium]
MVNIIINDKNLEVDDGKSILEAALEAGIKIPTLCYHKELSPYGACRLCVVEIVGGARPSLQASCLYKVTEGLIIKTDSERVRRTRKIVMELLLAMSPETERLQELAKEYGLPRLRIKPKDKGNCILCGLCVRACREIVGVSAISFKQRGLHRKVGTPFDKINDVCIGCGACAYICPTGTIKIEQA